MKTEKNISNGVTLESLKNTKEVGNIGSEDLHVYINQNVFQSLEKFSREGKDKEVGSILLGETGERSGKRSIIITNYIEAKYSDSTTASLTFTHETWEYIHNTKDEHFEDKLILGWQHTHPGYGIFLSKYDLFIQENYFNLPFQIAYVIDPKKGQRGFFQWKNGVVAPLSGFYLYDVEDAVISIGENDIEEVPIHAIKQARLRPSFTPILALFALLTVFVSGYGYSILISKIQQLEAELESQTSANDSLASEVRNAQSKISELSERLNESLQNTKILFQFYTVQEGDTLYKILQAHSIPFNENIRLIMGLNGISDQDMIYSGQRLILPTMDESQEEVTSHD